MNEDTVIITQDNPVSEEDTANTEVTTENDIPSTEVPEEETQNDVPDTATEEAPIKEVNEADVLRKELETLKIELEEKKKTFERMSREIGEFSEVFPEKSVNSIPDSVWESVKAGIPLAAAYALYERKNAVRADTASRINERNGAASTGSVGRTSTENFYTPDEVRAMSRSEVRKNYSKIIDSMKKWN